MKYTLGQAAKETGVSKPTLSRAVKNGDLSQRKGEGAVLTGLILLSLEGGFLVTGNATPKYLTLKPPMEHLKHPMETRN
jgi:hypothetical protein